MIPIKSKSTEEDIKAYLYNRYSVFGGHTYIFSDRGGKFISKQFAWLAEELGFVKVYTSPQTPMGSSALECTHSFLKASIRKLIWNHNTDWDELANMAMMAYNVFLHSAAGESPFYLMFGCNTFLPTLFKLLLPKHRYMGDEECRIYLDTMGEIHMITVLNL